jgi:hypothetical protein
LNKYILDSFPLSSRSIFFWWVTRIKAQIAIPYKRIDGTVVLKIKATENGKAKPAIIELRDT